MFRVSLFAAALILVFAVLVRLRNPDGDISHHPGAKRVLTAEGLRVFSSDELREIGSAKGQPAG